MKKESETKSKEKETKIFHKFENSTKYLFMLYITGCLYFFKGVFEVEEHYKSLNLEPTENWQYLLIGLGFIISRSILKISDIFVSKYLIDHIVDKNKYNETRNQHVYRVVKIFYSIIYYTLASIINFYLISRFQRDHLPKFFGGDFELTRFAETWPNSVHVYVQRFFLVSIGHHVERTYDHMYCQKKYLNYWTMLLHHVLTINLMVICFAHRQYLFGIPILLIHDITDVFLSLMKICREIKFLKFLTMPAYFLVLISWFFTRNYIFNKEIIFPMWFKVVPIPEVHKNINHMFAVFGLGILMILNTYWLFALFHAGYRKIFYNVEKSIHEGENAKTN